MIPLFLRRRVAAAGCLLLVPWALPAATYYVDATGGSDSNAGTSAATAWQTLTKVNSIAAFAAGDAILFARGRTWTGQLAPKGSGSAGAPIKIGAYGSGAAPLLNGAGVLPATVWLKNQNHWEIADLEITNAAATAALRLGILVDADDGALHEHIHILNVTVHDVTGDPNVASRESGGIQIDVDGQNTRWNDVLIDGCHIYNVGRTGIIGPYNTVDGGDWEERTPTNNMNWVPSTNCIIQNCVITDCEGNGLIWRLSSRPMIRNNLFANNGTLISGNAMFVFNTDDAIIQENEAYGQVFNTGDTDAAGFDIDYKNKRTILQYNYAHDNDQGGITVTAGSVAFNVQPIVRYNILQQNKRRGIYFSGTIDSARIYNNTIYAGPGLAEPVRLVYMRSWGGWPDDTRFYNNIFANYASGSFYEFGSATGTVFDYNIFYDAVDAATDEPADAHKLTSNPLLISPGSAGTGLDSLDGYMLRDGSPAINSGVNIAGNGNSDYWGNYVSDGGVPNRGAHNGAPGYRLEAELLTRTATGATTTVLNETEASDGSYVRLNSDGSGDYVQFTTGTIAAGKYDVRLRYKGFTNRGQHAVTIDGTAVGGTIDQYSGTSVYGTKAVGRVTFASAGTHTIRLTVTGKNAAATDYQVTADRFVFVPVPEHSMENENLTWTAAGAATQVIVDSGTSGGKWVHLGADGVGDYYEFTTRRVPAGTYRLKLRVKAYTNRGTHTVHVDGTQVGGTFDQYAAATTHTTIDCGLVTLTTGELHRVRLTVNGKNASSTGYELSASRIIFEPQ